MVLADVLWYYIGIDEQTYGKAKTIIKKSKNRMRFKIDIFM